MNKNIAIINTSIGTSYDQQIITLMNETVHSYKNINAAVYTTSMNIAIPQKKFSVLPLYEAKYFNGKAIVWDIISLDLVYGFPNISEILYIHNNTIPWRENSHIAYKVWEKLFTNSKTKILITDKNIYEIFRLTWNTGIFQETIDSRIIYESI